MKRRGRGNLEPILPGKPRYVVKFLKDGTYYSKDLCWVGARALSKATWLTHADAVVTANWYSVRMSYPAVALPLDETP